MFHALVLRNRIWMVSLSLLTLLLPVTAIAQIQQNDSGPIAEVYAGIYNVSVEEAERRLELQAAAGDLDAKLSSDRAATFAGL